MSTDRLEQEIRGDIESLEKLLDGTGSRVDDYRGIDRSRVRHLLNIIDKLRSGDPGVAVAPPLPHVEIVAAAVHDAWMAQKRAKGITSALSQQTGEEQMRQYAELSDAVQEYDRATVRAVYAAIEALRAVAPPQERI